MEAFLQMSDSIGTKEFAEKWNVKQYKVSEWCRLGLIPGANQDKVRSPWHIPKNATPPKIIKGEK